MGDTSLFGTRHLVFVAISIALIVVLYIFARKLSIKQASRILLYVGIVSEIIKVFYYIQANEDKLNGVLPKSDLPFHLCSIQIILILIVNLSKSEKLNRLIYSFMVPSCLFGGIA
ncbi:MAG: YwaF family protein, partial [Clostridia bacterium]|nr:YwaF family protein [Clostridia bacterium]